MAQYIRIKRKNQTIFLSMSTEDKVVDVKAKVAKINEKEPNEVGLIFNEEQLPNDKTLAECNVENDNIVYLVYNEGGEWEKVDIQKPEEGKMTED
ncbi:hypothetical protein QOT17_022137 [Balamuthia mandrillaris]